MTTENLGPSKSNLLYACSQCLKWISESAAIIFAYSKDSIKHFCNTECHDKWCEKHKENKQKAEGIL